MKDIIKYISIVASLCVFFSCSLKEDLAPASKSSVEYVARLTGFNNVDVTTKSAPTEEFETAVYTAYFLLFDTSTGNRIAFESIDVSSGLLSHTVVGKMPGSVTACFIANVYQDDVNDLTTIGALNSAVLDITYSTYSEAGGYLGVPKLNVNGESKLCIPMFGSKIVSNLTNGGNIEIPVKRLFAKVSMNIKMQLTNVGIGQIVPSTVNYELSQYQLRNLPTKVRLVGNDKENETTYESEWVDVPSAFVGNNVTPISSDYNLGLQTVNINDSDNDTTNNSDVVPGIDLCFYVPEYYLQPISNPNDNQKFKPQNYDYENKYAIYLELEGEVNRSLIDNTGISYNIFLGGDNTKNFILKRNLHYINQITIKGTENNNQGDDNIDHRVSVDIVNNPVAQAGKAANCYIIAEPGEYTIPAYKGAYNNLNGATLCMAGKDLSEYETRVEPLVNVVEAEGLTSITFSDPPTYDPETNTISFTVDPMLGNENWVPNGSVIIALQYRKKGETTWITEWSWHLWFMYSISASEDGWGTIQTNTMIDETTEMMDRNLGVHAFTGAANTIGFYYKYGEHTPYLDPDGDDVYAKYGGGSIGTSTPTWSTTEKTVTDPCPPGYRVPPSSVWSDNATKEHTLISGFRYWGNIYYPYSGYIDTNTMRHVSNFTPDDTYEGVHEDEENVLGIARVRNVSYSLELKYTSGSLLGADKKYVYESVDEGLLSDLQISKLQLWVGFGSLGYWQDVNANNSTVQKIIGGLIDIMFPDVREELEDVMVLAGSKTINSSHCHQIRCVKEDSLNK